MALHKHTKDEIRDYLTDKFHYNLARTVDEIHPTYQWDVSCQGSVPESIICFLEGNDFIDVVRMAVSLGGHAAPVFPVNVAVNASPRRQRLENNIICGFVRLSKVYL